MTTSRRDDLISLCYLMIYLLDGDLVFLENEPNDDSNDIYYFEKDKFDRIKDVKNKLTTTQICRSIEG